MTKPATTTTNYNTTTTTTTKPSTMEAIKDKAATLVDKVTGKHHDGTHHTSHTTHTTDVHNPNAPHNHAHNGPLHTGAAAAGTAVPHGASVDRAAYQQQPGAPANSIPVTGQQQQHHGHNANVDPNHVHPSVIPHGTTTTTTTSAAGTHIPAGGHHNNVHHPAPAGPTGTTNVPTYAQNIPPTAAGVVPTAYTAEQVHDPNHAHNHSKQHDNHHTGGLSGLLNRHHDDHHHKGTTGHDNGVHAVGGVPVNTNNSTVPVNQSNIHHATPVHTDNNTVPAMGAPGTTTAAGTHMPGGFNNNTTTTHHDHHHQQQYGHDGSMVPPPVPNKNTPAPVL